MSFYDSLNKLAVGILLLRLFGIPAQGDELMFFIVAFILGIVFQWGVRVISKLLDLDNNYSFLRRARKKVYKDVPNDSVQEKDKDGLKHEYLLAYYNVAKHGVLMNIPVLEATENFLRNLILMTPLYLVKNVVTYVYNILVSDNLSFLGDPILICVCLLALLLILLYLIRKSVQIEIHKLIWEGDRYLRKLEETGE